jgi:hypothetical protein
MSESPYHVRSVSTTLHQVVRTADGKVMSEHAAADKAHRSMGYRVKAEQEKSNAQGN